MTEKQTATRYRCLRQVYHDRLYQPGEDIELTDAQGGEQLLWNGDVELAEEEPEAGAAEAQPGDEGAPEPEGKPEGEPEPEDEQPPARKRGRKS